MRFNTNIFKVKWIFISVSTYVNKSVHKRNQSSKMNFVTLIEPNFQDVR